MKILKFGGTSLGSAQRIKNATLLLDESSSNLVVLSAMSGVTNTLSDLYSTLINGDFKNADLQLDTLSNHFNETSYQLFEEKEFLNIALEEVKNAINEIKDKRDKIKLAELLPVGELISSRLFSLYLS